MDHAQTRNISLNAAKAAVCLSLLLVLAKAWVWMSGGSTAMLASLMDSALDLVVSASNCLAISYAHRPADDDHRYGHGKAEGVAALAQSAFIAGSCLFVVMEAVRAFQAPLPVGMVDASIILLVVATILTLALTRYQAYAARTAESLAVEADAAHYNTDATVNLGIIISLVAGKYLNWLWLDPLVAILVAIWLVYTARGIAMKALNMLLDREIEEDKRERLIALIRGTPGVEDMHDLRTRRSGAKKMISFDIEVDPNLTLIAAHEITREVEARILQDFPSAEVMIHVDPRGDTIDSRHKHLKDFHAR